LLGGLSVTLIRHGETEWNAAGRIQGQADVPLSDNGRRQALLLRERLAGAGFDHLYASDLVRSEETARLVFPGVALRLDRRLQEQHVGEFDGLTWQELLTG